MAKYDSSSPSAHLRVMAQKIIFTATRSGTISGLEQEFVSSTHSKILNLQGALERERLAYNPRYREKKYCYIPPKSSLPYECIVYISVSVEDSVSKGAWSWWKSNDFPGPGVSQDNEDVTEDIPDVGKIPLQEESHTPRAIPVYVRHKPLIVA